MKIYKGDIVEIITSEWKNQSEAVKSGRDIRQPQPFIGQRYEVTHVVPELDFNSGEYLGYDRIGGKFIEKSDCLMVYKRPFINFLKDIFGMDNKTEDGFWNSEGKYPRM